MQNTMDTIRASMKFHHIGVVVQDIQQGIAHYESLGMGPFQPVTTPVTKEKMHGKHVEQKRFELWLGAMGEAHIELIQPLKGESFSKSFLEERGEGISHICFEVADLDIETKRLEQKGCKVVSAISFENGGGNVYLDTGNVGGFMIELLQHQPE